MGEDRVEKAIKDFFVIPIIAIIGIYATASVIDSLLYLNNETFRIIFTGIGGVPFFIFYFKKKLSEL